jgi:DHA2 family multidrug resistance protein
MEVLDTTIANVALRYISGGLAVGPDQAAWVVTSYLVANSIVLSASGWIATVFGRRNFILACVALFTISSILCGLAWDLQSLLIFRVFQGLAGGGMTPVAQSILAASFPPQKRGQAFAIYGLAVVVAPVIGPVLGGWLSDNWSWHWCFFINAPVGALCFVLMSAILPDYGKQEREQLWARGFSFDYLGFILIAAFLGALEVVLDKGQEDDWFGSGFIATFATISATALFLFVPWELIKRDPLIDLRLLGQRQFASCFVVMLATGGILIATTQILPELLQDQFGYTATIAGEALSPGGIVTAIVMIISGRLSFVQPKYLIATGSAFVAAGMYFSTQLYGDLNFGFFAVSRMIIGAGLPLMFLPVTAASYTGIPANRTDEASAVINVARNFGGSVGVCIAQTTLAQREQFHQRRLAEHVGSWNPFYQQKLQATQHYLAAQPQSGGGPARTAVAVVGASVQAQATYLAYIDVFVVLGLIAALLVPLALTLRKVDLKQGPTSVAH